MYRWSMNRWIYFWFVIIFLSAIIYSILTHGRGTQTSIDNLIVILFDKRPLLK